MHDEAPLYWQVVSEAQSVAVLYVVHEFLQVFMATLHVHFGMAMHKPWLAAALHWPSQVWVTSFHVQAESALQPDWAVYLAEHSVEQV